MTHFGSMGSHKNKGNKFEMEDLWIGVDLPDDPSTLKIKRIRDSLAFREEYKKTLIKSGFISNVDLNKGKSEVSLCCEVLCLLSGLFRNPQAQLLENEKKEMIKTVSLVISYLKKIEFPFTRHDISIVRSLKNMIFNLQYDIDHKEVEFFVDLLLLHKNSPSVYALKNEIVSLFCGVLDYKDIRESISSKKMFYMLNNININTIGLIHRLISPSTYRWIKIEHVFSCLEAVNSKTRHEAFDTIVKWYTFGERESFRLVLEVLTKYICTDQRSLLHLGRIVKGNIEAQTYAQKIGLLEKICTRYEDEITENVVYALYSLVDTLESNRKYVAESEILPKIFIVFKDKCFSRDYDRLFTRILQFFRVMTRSILFLRNYLLDYPIIELLLDTLEASGDHTNKVLGLIVNLVLEYGDYKTKFVSYGGMEKVLKYKGHYPIEVLMIFKNFLYDTHWPTKELFLKTTDKDFLNDFFAHFEESRDYFVLENLFNLIRNLVCDDCLELILVNYKDLVSQVFKYLEICCSEAPVNEKVMVQILYTIGNLSANSPAFRDLLFLEGRMDHLKKACVTRDLCLAFVWIVINVSWKDEGYEERVAKLKEHGVKEFLLRMNARDSIILDKINTALENIK